MSAAKPFRLPPDIRAAILWDVPALRRFGPVAANLLEAFGPRRWDLDSSPKGPLATAALGIVAVGEQKPEEALRRWDVLLGSKEGSHRLLGQLLRVWFGGAETRRGDLDASFRLASKLSDSGDRARVCRKVAVAAIDVGDLKLAAAAARTALEASESDTRLHASIRGVLWQLGDRSVGFPSVSDDAPEDNLLSQPWISDTAFSAILEIERDRFEQSIRGMWGGTIRSGPTPLDSLQAAQRQADWAAAHGLRDSLLQLVCGFLLEGGARSDEETRWAAASWVLAGGRRIPGVLQRAERSLNEHVAHDLLELIIGNPLRAGSLQEVAASLWRHVSDSDVDWLLAALDPGVPGDITRSEARVVWANMLWRDPAGWYKRWLGLETPQRQSAILRLELAAIAELPVGAGADLLAVCELVDEPLRHAFARLGAALAVSEHADATNWFLAAPPETIQELAEWKRDAVPDDVLVRSIDATREIVIRTRDEALAGTIGLGGTDPRANLGGLAAALGQPRSDVEDLLVGIANDPRMVADFKMGAFQGLVFLRHAHTLSDRARAQIRSFADEPGPDMWGVIDTTILRAARLWTVADDLTADEVREIVGACRSPRRETRLLAVFAITDVLKAQPKQTLAAWTLVSALYDPEDEVLERALTGVRARALSQVGEATSVAVAAVIAAYRTGRNRVRRAAVRTAHELQVYPELSHLVDEAAHDPSWEVRFAATGR